MPRRENPLGPAEDELIRFAADLRVLREEAGTPTYRQLSARAHYSAAALSEAASGRKLPSLPVTLAYVRACDGDPVEWERRWRELAPAHAKPPAEPETRPDETVPYAGFAPIEDPELFAGRDDLVAELVARVREQRLTAVVGASGSGKTSLLRAGLLPRVGDHVVMTPGARPLEECAVRLADEVGMAPCDLYRELAAAPENLHLRIRQARADQADDLVFVVDQLEDAFGTQEGDAFLAAVVHAATAATSRVRFVLAVGAEVADRLPPAARDGQLHVGPMSADGLREAITDPAAAAGCRVETALLVRLIADTGGPGTLPFLQQALLGVWRRRRGTTLTVASYDATGDLPQLIADAAERAFTALDADGQRLARHLLPRLASGPRGLRRDDLDSDMAAVLDELVRARVVVADHDGVALAGRSLRDRWPRLRGWLAEDGDRLRVHRELADAAATWDSLGRDPGALYRGVRLDAARSRLHDPVITARERDFLQASVAAHTGERRRVRGLRAGLALLSVLVVLATGALAYAVRAGLSAEEQRNVALAQSALREAATLLDTDPALATQLTVAAHRLVPTAAGRTAVLTLFADPYAARVTGHAGVVHALAVSRAGDLLATAGDDTTLLWDISDPYHPRRMSELPIDATSVVFSADGRTAVTANERGALLWDVSDPARPRKTSVAGRDPRGETPTDVALGSDGRTLAVTRANEVRLYDVTVSDRPRRTRTLIGHTGTVTSVSISPDGTVIATASEDHSVRLWPVAGGPPMVLAGDEAPVTAPVLAVEFSPDGEVVATAGEDGSARLWRVADGAQLASLVVRAGPVRAVALGDGLLAAAGDDRSTVVWDVTDLGRPRELVALTGHTDSVTAVRFTPDGRNLITSSRDRTVRVVNIAEAVTGRVAGGSLAWGRDGTVLASGGAGRVLLSDVRDRYAPRTVGTVPGRAPSFAAGLLAAGGRLWDVTDPARPVPHADLGNATGSALSRDGRLLVTTYRDAYPRLWDVADPDHPRALADLPAAGARTAVFGGGVVATLGSEITVWDVKDPANPAPRTLFTRNWTGLALRPDGKVLAAIAADGTGWLIDTRRMTVLAKFPAGPTTALAFAPAGRALVTATGPAPRLWDVSNPRSPAEVATLRSDNGRTITAVAFSPDGGSFATTSADGAVHVWAATVGQVERRVCAIAHPRITAEQWERYLPGVPYRPPCP
ncbi:nSTAND1 domain-containing NTPase [Actinophytocola sp. KF-1]